MPPLFVTYSIWSSSRPLPYELHVDLTFRDALITDYLRTLPDALRLRDPRLELMNILLSYINSDTLEDVPEPHIWTSSLTIRYWRLCCASSYELEPLSSTKQVICSTLYSSLSNHIFELWLLYDTSVFKPEPLLIPASIHPSFYSTRQPPKNPLTQLNCYLHSLSSTTLISPLSVHLHEYRRPPISAIDSLSERV